MLNGRFSTIAGLALALVLVFFLAACEEDDSGGGAPSSSQNAGIQTAEVTQEVVQEVLGQANTSSPSTLRTAAALRRPGLAAAAQLQRLLALPTAPSSTRYAVVPY